MKAEKLFNRYWGGTRDTGESQCIGRYGRNPNNIEVFLDANYT